MRLPAISKLISREKNLADRLLYFDWAEGGIPASVKREGIRAYTLLVHAEIEAYFERISGLVVETARDRLIAGKPNRPMYCLLATCLDEGNLIIQLDAEDRLRIRFKADQATAANWADHCYGQMRKLISSNHGLQEKNLKALFCPLGLDIDRLDSVWRAHLDDLGRRRGAIAHSAMGMHQIDNAADIRKLVSDVFSGLADFHTEIRSLL